MLEVPVRNPSALQILDEGSELIRNVENPIGITEILRQPRDKRLRLLDPLHAEDRVPLTVDEHAAIDVVEFHAPGLRKVTEQRMNCLVALMLSVDATGKTLYGVAPTR